MATWPVAVAQSTALASGDARDERAPAVAVGGPLANNTNLAISEEEKRKRLRSENDGIVTAAELQESRRRRVALETCEAQMIHGMGNGALNAAVQSIGNDVQAIRNDVHAIGATVRNLRRRELNRNGVWTHILVETAGPNPIGVAPPTHPVSRDAVFRMTVAQIVALEAAFNLPPGTFNGVGLAARRDAVLEYLLDG